METFAEEPQQCTLQDENLDFWTFIRKESLKSIKTIENMLQNLGLSKNEIQVYLYLALYKERKASEISKALNLHRTNTYQILRDLEKKSLVSSTLEKPLKFIATPFEKAIDVLIETKKLMLQKLEEKKENLIHMWLSLPKPRIEGQQKEVFQILEGEEQITLKVTDAIQSAQRELCVFASESDLPLLYNSGIISKLEKFSNIEIKLLTIDSPKSRFFVEKARLQNKRYTLAKTERIPTFILIDQRHLFLVIKQSLEKNGKKAAYQKISALWTNYEAFIQALGALFAELWYNENTKCAGR